MTRHQALVSFPRRLVPTRVFTPAAAQPAGSTIARGVWRLFAIATCALLILIVALLAGLHQLTDDRLAIARTALIQRELGALGEALLDAETGQRGYLITRNAQYLAPYYAGISSAQIVLARLHDSILQPDSQDRLQAIVPVVSAKFAELSQTIALTRAGEQGAAVALVASHDGKRLMDQFRSIRADVMSRQTQLLVLQHERANTTMLITLFVLCGGGAASIVLLFFNTRRTVHKLGGPIRSLVDGMLSVASGAMNQRLPIAAGDEIGTMAAAFNTMAEQLEKSRAAESAAAHSLQLSHNAIRESERALRESQSFLARTGAVAGIGGWQIDLVDDSLTWSAETRRLFEVGPDYEPSMKDALLFYTEPSRRKLQQALSDCIVSAQPWDLELELMSAKGRNFWARTTGTIEMEDGAAVRLVGAFQDITERRRMEQKIADSNELVRVTLESIGDAVITTDQQGLVQWLNPVAESMTGWTKGEARHRPLTEVFRTLSAEPRQPGVGQVAVGLLNCTTLVSRDGREFGIEDSSAPIRDAAGYTLGAVLVFHDVTEQRRLSHEMTHRAAHDSLTGLVNRAEFEGRLTRLLSGGFNDDRVHVVMYIDLDEFKVVNDACGHAAGDQLLRQVSTLLHGNMRSRDTLARLGGDEFGVILESCSLERGHAIAQRICGQMDTYRFAYGGRRYRIGTSIGVVPVDSGSLSADAIIQAADSCCYAAKEAGRNRVHLWVESATSIGARHGDMQWVSRLEAALDDDQFELFAQLIRPTADLERGMHCEVLLRLRDDQGTHVMPGSFLSAAERYHLASRIDRWVLHQVFEILHADRESVNHADTIAINLSGQSLSDRDFHRDVLQLIRTARFDVTKLCFEITETAAITHLVVARGFIDELRSLGVRIALDDFGAGASSFGYLRSLPVDYLKIDGQFINGLLDDELDNAAVRCFCEVARVMGIMTIAEFVETTDVREELQRLGVDLSQGYLIHRPEPFAQLLANTLHRQAV
jgi:diguanylate cyclase (GGDEF)-like protein/PAS domain S-box-containing protein